MHELAERESRVRYAPGDDDVGAFGERADDRLHPDVGVRRENAVPDLRERPAGIHVAKLVAAGQQIVEPVENVIAGDEADADAASEPKPPGGLEHRLGTAAGIRSEGGRVGP